MLGQPLSHTFDWTTGATSRAPSAPADTRFFAQSDSTIIGPKVHAIMQVLLVSSATRQAT